MATGQILQKMLVLVINLGYCISLKILKLFRAINLNDHTPIYAFVQMLKSLQPNSLLPASLYNKFRTIYYQYRHAISGIENLTFLAKKTELSNISGLAEFISTAQTGCYGCGRNDEPDAIHQISIDGNFRLNRRKKKNENTNTDVKRDITFIEGTAVLSRGKDDTGTCGSNFRAGDGRSSDKRHNVYSETGILS
jgi:hypothetical protein